MIQSVTLVELVFSLAFLSLELDTAFKMNDLQTLIYSQLSARSVRDIGLGVVPSNVIDFSVRVVVGHFPSLFVIEFTANLKNTYEELRCFHPYVYL